MKLESGNRWFYLDQSFGKTGQKPQPRSDFRSWIWSSSHGFFSVPFLFHKDVIEDEFEGSYRCSPTAWTLQKYHGNLQMDRNGVYKFFHVFEPEDWTKPCIFKSHVCNLSSSMACGCSLGIQSPNLRMVSWHLSIPFFQVMKNIPISSFEKFDDWIPRGCCCCCCCWLLVVGCCFLVTKIPVNDPNPIRPSRMWIVHLWLHLHDSRPLWVARWAGALERLSYIYI